MRRPRWDQIKLPKALALRKCLNGVVQDLGQVPRMHPRSTLHERTVVGRHLFDAGDGVPAELSLREIGEHEHRIVWLGGDDPLGLVGQGLHFFRGTVCEVKEKDLLAFVGDESDAIYALHRRTTVAGCARSPLGEA